ncbi:MAG: sugar phosphate isomerase/epimerase [Verrucomicrobia bacterium]|nr:sugar phosphate isomerase/epimerase [Verrucomicrobiota bacterium]
MYSLSTCWNSNRHTDGRAMLREIRDLGFEYAELSHGIRISLLPGVIEAVDAGEIRISTLHNFCPLPIGVNHAAPNLFKFSSPDARERENAIRHSLKTIETAARLKARLVVLHLGCIEMKDYTERLIGMVENGEKDSPKYRKLCEEVEAKREHKKEKYLELAYGTLKRLMEEASARGIQLGIENREALEEIPLDSDFGFFFKEFNNSTVRYWHDTGHAQIKENLGFIQHSMHLESMADHLAGFHIHDVQFPGHDHLAPGTGMIDFASLKPFVQPDHIKVFEFGPATPLEEVKTGVDHLKSIWGTG